MNAFIAFLENKVAHWIGGAKKQAVDVTKLLAPLGQELATLAHDDAVALITTASTSLISNAPQIVAGTLKPSDALHQAGTAIKNQVVGMSLKISDEAISGLVATAAAAQKQAVDAATGLTDPPKPSNDAGTAAAGGAPQT